MGDPFAFFNSERSPDRLAVLTHEFSCRNFTYSEPVSRWNSLFDRDYIARRQQEHEAVFGLVFNDRYIVVWIDDDRVVANGDGFFYVSIQHNLSRQKIG